MTDTAALLEALNRGARTERSGSETGLDRLSDRYRDRDLYNAACDGYSLSAQGIDLAPYRAILRAGTWTLDTYEIVGGR